VNALGAFFLPGWQGTFGVWRRWAYFASGACAGAVATASVALLAQGFASPIPRPARIVAGVLFAAFISVGGLLDRLPTCEVARIIPQRDILATQPRRSIFWFAFELGTTLRTHTPTLAPHAVWLALALGAPSPVTIVISGVAYGLGRSVTALIYIVRSRMRPTEARLLGQRWLAGAFGRREQVLTGCLLAVYLVVYS
jgi:hypothetical protein